ncbi:hypothetical protein B2G74_00245 [Burkholderia sp. A27]|nr:hypothetical protein B2G74_00245 [Burkholderia sp. A27]
MSRRRPEFQTLDLASWPTLAWTELDAAQRSRVQRHIDAIERYASGEPVGSIETTTRINRRQLYRFLDRALSLHADGRIYGFRALVVHARVTEYTRLLLVLTIAASRVKETANAEFVVKRRTFRPKSEKSSDFALL